MGGFGLAATLFHFVVAMGLYLFTKMLRTQGGSYVRAVSAILIGVVDGANVVVAMVMLLKFAFFECGQRQQFPCTTANDGDTEGYQTHCIEECHRNCWTNSSGAAEDFCQPKQMWGNRQKSTQLCKDHLSFCQEQATDGWGSDMLPDNETPRLKAFHPYMCGTEPDGNGVRLGDVQTWQLVCLVWMMCVLLGAAAQWALALSQGLALASMNLARAKLETKRQDYGGESKADAKFELATAGFMSTTFSK